MTRKAYELREAVSETEKLRITYYFHNFVNGETGQGDRYARALAEYLPEFCRLLRQPF